MEFKSFFRKGKKHLMIQKSFKHLLVCLMGDALLQDSLALIYTV